MTQFVAPVAAGATKRAWQDLKQDDTWLVPFNTGNIVGHDNGNGAISGVSENDISINWQLYSDEACTKPVSGPKGSTHGKLAKGFECQFSTDPAHPTPILLPLNTVYYVLVSVYPGSLEGDQVANLDRDYVPPRAI